MNNKILILRLSSIGDILLTTPFVRQVRHTFPQAKIHYITKEIFKDLIFHNPHLDKIWTIQQGDRFKDLIRLRKQLNKENYDFVFDLHNSLRTKIIAPAQNRTRFSKQKWNRAQLVYLNRNRYKKIIPVAERYLQTGSAAGVKDDGLGLELVWKNATEKRIDYEVNKFHLNKGFVAFAPGAAHYTKRWPIERFKELSDLIYRNYHLPIVLFGSMAEREQFRPLQKKGRVYNFAGKFSLLESAALLNRARCLVSNDSGLMHMATAVNTKLVALFGSTVKELGFFPYRSEHKVIEMPVSCRPCSHIGRASCPKGHFNCMLDISVQHVFNTLEPWLKK